MQESTKSYLKIVAAMLIFGSIGLFRRYIPFSSGMLAFSRGIMGSIVVALSVKLKGGKLFKKTEKKELLLLVLSGAVMGFNWILLFEAYNYVSISTATLCYYMQPTIVIAISALLLKEKFGIKKAICAAVSLCGMIMVAGIFDGNASDSENSLKGILMGLGAAVLYACVVIINKFVNMQDIYEKTCLQLLSASVIMLPYLLLTQNTETVNADAKSIVMTLTVGIIHTGIAYVMYFSAVSSLPAQTTAILSYIDPVSALLFSALLLDEKLSIYGITGAVLIIGAALASEIKFKKQPG